MKEENLHLLQTISMLRNQSYIKTYNHEKDSRVFYPYREFWT